MAYNEKLAERIRGELDNIPFVEKKMFGGVGFLVHGNMACGVHNQSMIVRVDPGKHNALLKKPHARPFDITGKPMRNWVVVERGGVEDDDQLADWIWRAMKFVGSLPAREK